MGAAFDIFIVEAAVTAIDMVTVQVKVTVDVSVDTDLIFIFSCDGGVERVASDEGLGRGW